MKLRRFEQLESRNMMTTAFDVIGLPNEQQQFSFRGQGLNVAVLDSGDKLQSYIKGSMNFIDPNASSADGFGHGAFIESEIHEVAPAAGIYSLKVLTDQGTGPTSVTEKALRWVIDHYQQDNIVAVNYSIGYEQDDPIIDSEFETLAKDGVTVCVAAGNSQSTYPNTLSDAANCPDVISVGATWTQFLVNVNFNGATDFQTQTDKIAAYSQRSNELGILAPGDVHINGLKDETGTSMSTALVTGASVLVYQALLFQGKPSDEHAILAVMQDTGKQIFDGLTTLDNVQHTDDTFARLDVGAAIVSIMPPPPPVQTSSPTNATFVASLYTHVLSRDPDASGLAYWVSLLDSGDSRADVAARIWSSDEHMRHHTAESVEQLYESLLGRPGDSGGLAYFAGKSESFTAVTMLSSPEFFSDSLP